MAYLNESGLSYLWSKIKAYITNVANGKANAVHGHSYNDLSDKPTIPAAYSHPSSHPASMITGLADVATSGSYEDLTNKPSIPAAYNHPANHPASMITGLADVATSGSYNDLADKPSIPAAYNHPASHPASMITGLATVATSGAYADLTGKPTIPTAVSQLSDAAEYAKKSDLSSVFNYKGSKASASALPTTGNTVGDVWDVEDTGMNYAWTGTEWDPLGMSLTIETITNAQIDAIIV